MAYAPWVCQSTVYPLLVKLTFCCVEILEDREGLLTSKMLFTSASRNSRERRSWLSNEVHQPFPLTEGPSANSRIIRTRVHFQGDTVVQNLLTCQISEFLAFWSFLVKRSSVDKFPVKRQFQRSIYFGPNFFSGLGTQTPQYNCVPSILVRRSR